MGLPWLKVFKNLPEHRKSKQLERELGERNAFGYLIRLWAWCVDNAPDGKLEGRYAQDVVEDAAGWRGEPGRLFKALLEFGWLDAQGDEVCVHDWDDYAGAHISKAERDAEAKRLRRQSTEAAPKRRADGARRARAATAPGAKTARARRSNGAPLSVSLSVSHSHASKQGEGAGEGAPVAAPVEAPAEAPAPPAPEAPSPAVQVFEHWRAVMGKDARTRFEGKRLKAVEARLEEGYSVEDLCLAVNGCAVTPHNMGHNERGQRYDDLELICRDASHVDRFRDNARNPPRPPGPAPPRMDNPRGYVRADDEGWRQPGAEDVPF